MDRELMEVERIKAAAHVVGCYLNGPFNEAEGKMKEMLTNASDFLVRQFTTSSLPADSAERRGREFI